MAKNRKKLTNDTSTQSSETENILHVKTNSKKSEKNTFDAMQNVILTVVAAVSAAAVFTYIVFFS